MNRKPKEELTCATLKGTDSESLTIQFWQEEDLEYANFFVHLTSPATIPPMEQMLDTSSYQLRDATKLTELLDGDSAARFELDALHFDLAIYEHTWGVRYGYIAELNISTIKWAEFAPWPKNGKIGDLILDGHPTAGCLKFAFRCEYDSLRAFAKQLDIMYLQTPDRSKRR